MIAKDGKTEVAWATWCQGKSENWFWSGVGHWRLTENQCPTLPDQAWVNDGLGVGGLTQKQTDTSVGQLAGYEGLINARGKVLSTEPASSTCASRSRHRPDDLATREAMTSVVLRALSTTRGGP